jgi:hypothetical protein
MRQRPSFHTSSDCYEAASRANRWTGYASEERIVYVAKHTSHSLHGEDNGVVSCVWAAFGFRPCRHRLIVVCPSVRAQGSSNRVMRLHFSSASVLYVLVCRRCAGARLSKIVLLTSSPGKNAGDSPTVTGRGSCFPGDCLP